MRYQPPMAEKDEKQRRPPPGVEYVVTDEILAGLRAFRRKGDGRKTYRQIAQDIAPRLGGHVVDPASISNIVLEKTKTSALAHAIAATYGWAMPPVARTGDDQLAEGAAMLAEIKLLSEEFGPGLGEDPFAHQIEGIRQYLKWLRSLRAESVSRETADDD